MLDSGQRSEQIRADLELISLFEHDGELFARYRIVRQPA